MQVRNDVKTTLERCHLLRKVQTSLLEVWVLTYAQQSPEASNTLCDLNCLVTTSTLEAPGGRRRSALCRGTDPDALDR